MTQVHSPRPDASTFRRLTTMANMIRGEGVKGLWRAVLTEIKQPAAIPGRVWRAVWVLSYLAGMRSMAFCVRPFSRNRSLTLFYDLSVSPVTYDICWALAGAERLRLLRDLDSVHVVFVAGPHAGLREERPDYEAVVTPDARRRRLHEILIPLVGLLPSSNGFSYCTSRVHATILRVLAGKNVYPKRYWPALPVRHWPIELLEAARRGEKIPLPLHSTPAASQAISRWRSAYAKGRRIITITLREYDYMPARNSNVEAWLSFGRVLAEEGMLVVVVPDTEQAVSNFSEKDDGLLWMPQVALEVDLRMALYECAWLNMMVNTGPHLLCMFNETCHYLMFKILTEGVPQTTPEYMRELGFEIDKSPPFSTAYQKWVWGDDNEQLIRGEFARMREVLPASSDAEFPAFEGDEG